MMNYVEDKDIMEVLCEVLWVEWHQSIKYRIVEKKEKKMTRLIFTKVRGENKDNVVWFLNIQKVFLEALAAVDRTIPTGFNIKRYWRLNPRTLEIEFTYESTLEILKKAGSKKIHL